MWNFSPAQVDGRNSTVARLARAPYLREDPALTYSYYTYWSGIPLRGLRLYGVQGAGAACVPTQDGLTLVALQVVRDGAVAPGDRQPFFRSMVRRVSPDLWRELAHGRQEDRLFCCADQPNFFRRPYDPGWALAGDAAHTKDPIAARGISDAFTQAAMLSGCLEAPLDDPCQVEEALTRYGESLLRRFSPAYEATLFRARLDVSAYRQELIDHQHDSVWVGRFFRDYAGLP